MDKFKFYFSYLFSKKRHWLPSLLIIIIVFMVLIFVGKMNPILFFYSKFFNSTLFLLI